MLTIVMQSAGMAGLVLWARAHLTEGIRQFGLVRAAVLVVRFTSLIVCLHVSEILLWACFFRWNCFCNLGICFLLFGGQLFDGRLWRSLPPEDVESRGPRGESYWRADVWSLSELAFCNCDPAHWP